MKRITILTLFILSLFINAQQFALPPQPFDPLAIEKNGTDTFLLSWATDLDRPYLVEVSPNLTDWVPLSPLEIGTGLTRMIAVTSNADKMFYRHSTGAIRRGLFLDGVLPINDDTVFSPKDLGFSIDISGEIFTDCRVNTNGNLSFRFGNGTFIPAPLLNVNFPIFAPFWADVDIRPSFDDEAEVIPQEISYGVNTVDGNLAFGATYKDVGYFPRRTDLVNSFQVVVINRPDTGSPTNFDVEFNYDQIDWETGGAVGAGGVTGFGGISARAGVTNGDDETLEILGSGINSALLDKDAQTQALNLLTGLVYTSRNSTVPGRHVFEYRNGSLLGGIMVDAGPDLRIDSFEEETIQLAGVAVDPSGGTLSVMWSVIDTTFAEIEDFVFSDPTDLNSTLTFPGTARAVVQLTVTSDVDPTRMASDSFRID